VTEPEADDAPRITRLFLESLREGRIDDARIQIEALHDVTPQEPRFMFNARGELAAEAARIWAEAEPEAEL
jgi:hypothetical protein